MPRISTYLALEEAMFILAFHILELFAQRQGADNFLLQNVVNLSNIPYSGHYVIGTSVYHHHRMNFSDGKYI